MRWNKTLVTLACLSSASLLYSVDVADSTDLQAAIIAVNSGGGTINFTGAIDLTLPFGQPLLRPLNTAEDFSVASPQLITINGNGNILDGGSAFRGFFVRSQTVHINDLSFRNTKAQGGTSANSGGGGAGLGGALFISNGATVILTNPSFIDSEAIGGNGGIASQGSGGGGGLTGNGAGGFNVFGSISVPLAGGGGSLAYDGGQGFNGGGGGGGVGGPGTNASTVVDSGGNGGPDFSTTPTNNGGAAAGGVGGNGLSGQGGGGGGGNGFSGGAGGDGGGGGGGSEGNGVNGGSGGAGGIFGGGGAGNLTFNGGPAAGDGGAGGFGGGGGASGTFTVSSISGNGGAGGFGGGGGGSGGFTPGKIGGVGGFGGGNGGQDSPGGGGGGGGAGFGGAIFIQDGGSLIIQCSANFSGNSVTAGASGGGGATAGSKAGADIFMMSGSNLTFDITQNVSIPNPIEGNQGDGGGSTVEGGLAKQGCAILTLNGANTYTGTTFVDAGELRIINGSVTTDIEVAENAILSGDFTIKKNGAGTNNGDLINAGIVSAGVGGVGQINIEGNFVNETTGVLVIDITPNGTVHDTLVVSGTATLNGGVLNVIVNAGNYIKGTQYVIINAPVFGKFAQEIETGVNADLIDIEVTYSSVILTVINNRIFENQTIFGTIANRVADCIRTADITPRSDFAIIVEQMGLISDSEVSRALFNLAPVNYGALDWINARNNSYVADILSKHLFELCCSPRDCCGCSCNTGIWIDVFGNFMDTKKHFDSLSPFEANAVGVVTGLDYCFRQNFTIGLGFGYTHTWLDWRRGLGDGNIDSYYGALYGSYQGCWFNIDLSAIGGGSDHDLKRNIDISGSGVQTLVTPNLCSGAPNFIEETTLIDIHRSAKSAPWGYFFTGHLGLSADWEWYCTTFEPFGLVDYNYFHLESFKEHGAESLNLKLKEHHQNILRGEAGLRIYHTWVCKCFCVAPYIGGSWVGEFPLGTSKQKASFLAQPCVFEVSSYHSSVQFGSPQAGIKWTRNSGFSFLLGYKGLFSSKTHINEVEGRLEWVF